MARIPGYRIAGKTGTAQKVIGGRVVQGVYIGSFIGFAPVPNPKVSILVSVDEPQGAFYGGQVAAPVFGRVMTQVLKYLKIPPNVPMKRVPRGQQMVPNLVNLDMDQARQSAQAYGFPLQFTGQGSRVVGQSIEYGAWRPAGTALTATLGNQRVDYLQWVTVPDFRGLDASSSAHLAFNLGMNTQPTGVLGGRVISQSIAAGTEVKSGSTIGIRLG